MKNKGTGCVLGQFFGKPGVEFAAAVAQSDVTRQISLGSFAPHDLEGLGRGCQQSGRAPIDGDGSAVQQDILPVQHGLAVRQGEARVRNGSYDCKHRRSISVKASSRA